jgi:transcription antitermination factor NusG
MTYIPLAERAKHPLPEPKWYAVMTAPGCEWKADMWLRRRGYWTWLPFIKVKKTIKRANSNARKIVIEDRPYYRRYLFVAFRYEGDNFADVHAALGVSTVVKAPMSGQPLQIPLPVMEELMAMGDGCGYMGERNEVSRKRWKRGEEIRFKDASPFAGFVAQVLSDDGGKELRVAMEFFGGLREVAVKPEHIVQATEPKRRKAA